MYLSPPCATYYNILISVAEREEDWSAGKVVRFAEAAFEIALVAPVEEAKIATINHEPWRARIGLHHIAELWMSILEACRWMRCDGVHKKFVEVGSL